MDNCINFAHHGQETIDYKNNCYVCGADNIITVDKVPFMMWYTGSVLVQEAFPDLHADERELIMTGIHARCWDKMFEEQ